MYRLCAAMWTALACFCVFSSIIACICGSWSQYSWQRVWPCWEKHREVSSFCVAILMLLAVSKPQWKANTTMTGVVEGNDKKRWELLFTAGEKRLKSFCCLPGWLWVDLFLICCTFLFGDHHKLNCCVKISSYRPLAFFLRKTLLRILTQNQNLVLISYLSVFKSL